MNLHKKQKQIHRHRKQSYGYQKGKEGEQMRSLGLTDPCYYIYRTNNKNLLYSTGNSTQYSVITYMGKEYKKNG